MWKTTNPNFLSSPARHTCRRKGKSGFTLIELLIVIVIISIISSVAVITIHSNENKQFETLANQLARTFRLAEEEAMLRSTTLGFALTPKTYQFFEYQENKKTWKKTTTPTLGLHDIPNNTRIILKIHGKVIELTGKPQIIISTSSDITPFVMLIGKKDSDPTYRVIGKANGEVKSGHIPES